MGDKIVSKVRVWLAAFRVKFFSAGIPPVILGAAVAYYETGALDPWLFSLTLIGITATMIGTYTYNEYFDYKSGVDVVIKPENITPFNAGSRVLPQGYLRPGDVLAAGTAAWLLMLGIGLYLAWVKGSSLIIVLMAIGAIAALGYTTPPMKWAYRGLGEALIGISYGPVITLGSYAVQTGGIGATPLVASLMPGFLITAVIWINEFPDYEADAACGKRNLVVRLGKGRALRVYQAILALAYVSVPLGVLSGAMPAYTLASLATAPLAVRASKTAEMNLNSPRGLIPAMRDTVLTFVLSTLLLVIGFALPRWL